MAEIFISHIHEEKTQAQALSWFLRDRLKRDSFLASNLWDLRAGEEWLERIRTELQSCRVMLSMLSPQSIKRPWINFEAGAAWVTKKPVIPCCHAGLKKGELPQPFATLQALDMPDDLYALVVAVSHYVSPGTITPPPVSDELEEDVRNSFRGQGFHPRPPPYPSKGGGQA